MKGKSQELSVKTEDSGIDGPHSVRPGSGGGLIVLGILEPGRSEILFLGNSEAKKGQE